MCLIRRILIELTESPIELPKLLATLDDEACGAVVLFLGRTRRWTKGQETLELHYESYREMALLEMNKLKEEACHRFPGLRVALVHRLGQVAIGENSVAVAVASPHRKAAFEAGRWLIDELKRQVPIWKRELLRDGQTLWQHPQPEAQQPTPPVDPAS